MTRPCQNVSGQKCIQQMLIYHIMLKKCIYTVIYAYAKNRGLPSLLYVKRGRERERERERERGRREREREER